MGPDRKRELLLEFCAAIELRPAAEPTDGVLAYREGVVDEFLRSKTPGFAGYSDEELKGTARESREEAV